MDYDDCAQSLVAQLGTLPSKYLHYPFQVSHIFNGDLTISSSQLQELFHELTADKPVIIDVLSKVCAPCNTTMHTFCC